jgi:hypothetical protein
MRRSEALRKVNFENKRVPRMHTLQLVAPKLEQVSLWSILKNDNRSEMCWNSMDICGVRPGSKFITEVSRFNSIKQDVSAKKTLEIASRDMT